MKYVIEYLISPHLRFVTLWNKNKEFNWNVFPQFGKLLELKLTSTSSVGDKCLQEIGIHCKNLRYFNTKSIILKPLLIIY